jgi:hypothetical protein
MPAFAALPSGPVAPHRQAPKPTRGGAVGAYFACSLLACLALVFALAVPALAQSASQQKPTVSGQSPPVPGRSSRNASPDSRVPVDDDGIDGLRHSQLIAARQQALFSDTNKLVKLAAELNAEISSSPSSLPGKEQLRKAVQIEKLARNVQRNMKNSLTLDPEGPVLMAPPPPRSSR